MTASKSKVGIKNNKQLKKRFDDDKLNKTILAISMVVKRKNELSKKKQDRLDGCAKWKKIVKTSMSKVWSNNQKQQQKKRISDELSKAISSIAMVVKRSKKKTSNRKQKRSRSWASSSSQRWSNLNELLLQSLPPVFILHSPSFPDSFILHTIPEPGVHLSNFLPNTAGKFWAGFSHGHLIMLDNPTHQKASLVHPVEATTVELPESPVAFSRAILTDIPTAPDSWLLGWGGNAQGHLIYYNLHGGDRTVIPCDISNIIPLGDDDYVLVQPPSRMTLARWFRLPQPVLAELMVLAPLPLFDALMVQIDGKLWALSFPRWVKDTGQWVWFEACWHDPVRREWMRVDDRKMLEGRVLLVSNSGESRVVETSSAWGGQGNCIYYREMRCGRIVRLWLEDLKLEFLFESDVPATSLIPYKGSREIGWICSDSYDLF